ncbi:serine/threonine-protein kinase [Actinomycetospora flava]|uniref:non-specific serine/threonine protein kinase n=1 Tax=Actinomycetospora flava TaxID=3129232 RepID=A0ABU8M432_9PSEU
MSTRHVPSALPTGAETFGPYRLEERIGRGGMGEVFRAFDTSRERTVAVKRLHAGLGDDAEYTERFRRESRTVARLSSPHVIPIHDFGTIDGRLYIDMRLVSGDDLAAVIERHGRLGPARAVEIVRQVADALDTAHEDGLVHRDVKPSNVLIAEQRDRDFVYLVDFGIVRAVGGAADSGALTGTGMAIGTLAYMAPEVFVSRDPDRRVDIYALGCLLFEAVAGRPPFLAEGPALMYEHLNETPPRLSAVVPDVPPGLDAVVATAMAKDPAGRYATAGELADAAVLAVGGHVSGPVPTTTTGTGTTDAATTVHRTSGPVGGSAPPTLVPGPRSGSTPGMSPMPPWQPTGPAGPPPLAPPPYHQPAYPPPPSRGRGRVVALVAGLAVLLLLLAGGALVLTAQAPTPPAPTPAPAAAMTLTQVFPGATGSSCRASTPDDQLTTSTGANPAEAIICAYPDVAPDARVIYARWPDAGGARAWYGDTERLGPRLDQYATWDAGGVVQGPLYTAQRDGTICSTGIYEGMAYSWEIRTATMDQSWAVWQQLRFRPRTEIGG